MGGRREEKGERVPYGADCLPPYNGQAGVGITFTERREEMFEREFTEFSVLNDCPVELKERDCNSVIALRQ